MDGPVVGYELALELGDVLERVGPGRPDELAGRLRDATTAHLADGLSVTLDGAPCPGTLGDVEVTDFEGKAYAVLTSSYRCPAATGTLRVGYDLLLDELAAKDGMSHANVADWEVAGGTGRIVFERDTRELVVGPDGTAASAYAPAAQQDPAQDSVPAGLAVLAAPPALLALRRRGWPTRLAATGLLVAGAGWALA